MLTGKTIGGDKILGLCYAFKERLEELHFLSIFLQHTPLIEDGFKNKLSFDLI